MILLIGFIGVLVIYVMVGVAHIHGHLLDIEHFLGMHNETNYWEGGKREQSNRDS